MTPPTFTLRLTASRNTADGTEALTEAATVRLRGSGGSVLLEAADDDGVGWVELWESARTKACGDEGGAEPALGLIRRVEGQLTDTQAPETLTASFDINTLDLQPACTYTFEVSGKAANAATEPVEAKSPIWRLELRT